MYIATKGIVQFNMNRVSFYIGSGQVGSCYLWPYLSSSLFFKVTYKVKLALTLILYRKFLRYAKKVTNA